MTKKELALDAIRRVHANTRNSFEETKDELEEIRELCDELIEAVEADIKMYAE